MRNKAARTAVCLYAIIGFYQIVVQELTPLWALNDASHGGLDFEASDIGVVLTLLAPFQITCQLLLYPRAVERCGYRRLFFYTLLTSATFTALMPSASALHPWPRSAQIAAVAALQCGIMVPIFFSFTTVFVLINNSVPRSSRGAVNGVSQSLVALTRMTGPTLGGSAFAWSESNGLGWPFDFHLMWYLVAATGVSGAYLSKTLPQSVEKQFVEDSRTIANSSNNGGSSGTGSTTASGDENESERASVSIMSQSHLLSSASAAVASNSDVAISRCTPSNPMSPAPVRMISTTTTAKMPHASRAIGNCN